MSLLGSIIVSVCVGAGPGTYQAACTNALDAGSQQTGFSKKFDGAERRVSRSAEGYARQIVPDEAEPMIGSFVFIAKTAVDRRLTIGLPNMGFADQIQSQLTPNSAVLSIKWSF